MPGSHGAQQRAPSLCDPLVGRVPPADPAARGHRCARALFPLRAGRGALGEQTPPKLPVCPGVCPVCALRVPTLACALCVPCVLRTGLLWLGLGCFPLHSAAAGRGLQVPVLSPAWDVPSLSLGSAQARVSQGLGALVRKRLSEHKLLLTMMFCSSRKELLLYKSPVLVHRGPDSRFLTLLALSIFN